jgi:hypothetical protein
MLLNSVNMIADQTKWVKYEKDQSWRIDLD